MRNVRSLVLATAMAVVLAGCAAEEPGIDAGPGSAEDGAAATGSDDGATGSDEGATGSGEGRISDDRSGVSFTLDEAVDPTDQDLDVPGGGSLTARMWFIEDREPWQGVSVFYLEGTPYDLELGMDGAEQGSGGTPSNRRDITVDGHQGLASDLALAGDVHGRLAMVQVGDHVVQVMSGGTDRDDVDATFQALVESVDIP